MIITKKKEKVFSSFEEYTKKFYPDTYKQSLQSNDPHVLGVKVARELLNKHKHVLLQK